jgi:hypothetical protein
MRIDGGHLQSHELFDHAVASRARIFRAARGRRFNFCGTDFALIDAIIVPV